MKYSLNLKKRKLLNKLHTGKMRIKKIKLTSGHIEHPLFHRISRTTDSPLRRQFNSGITNDILMKLIGEVYKEGDFDHYLLYGIEP